MGTVRRATIATLAVALIVSAGTVTADARRLPTKAERAAIMRGADVRDYGGSYPDGSYYYTVRVATAARGWAAVRILPTRAGRGLVQPDVISARRTGAGLWKRHQVGNGGGCRMPERVRRDLGLYCY
jgi:hypothetical protein